MFKRIITVVIVEDEPHCVTTLKGIIEMVFPDKLEIVGVFSDVRGAAEGIPRLQPDLVLLDVELGNDDCFSLLLRLQPVDFEIIFTTAHNKYMEQALECCCIGYLLKPIAVADLRAAIERLDQRRLKMTMAQQVAMLIHNNSQVGAQPKCIAIPVADGLEFINTDDIIWVEASGPYATLHLPDKQTKLTTHPLAFFEDLLISSNFYRIHNSFLINLRHMKKYHSGRGGYVKMSDGTELEVSTRRKDDFLKRIGKGRWW